MSKSVVVLSHTADGSATVEKAVYHQDSEGTIENYMLEGVHLVHAVYVQDIEDFDIRLTSQFNLSCQSIDERFTTDSLKTVMD